MPPGRYRRRTAGRVAGAVAAASDRRDRAVAAPVAPVRPRPVRRRRPRASATCSSSGWPTPRRFAADLRRVAGGGTVLDPDIAESPRWPARSRSTTAWPASPVASARSSSLLAEGRSNAAIAEALVITEKSVVEHVSKVYEALEAAADRQRTPPRAGRPPLPLPVAGRSDLYAELGGAGGAARQTRPMSGLAAFRTARPDRRVRCEGEKRWRPDANDEPAAGATCLRAARRRRARSHGHAGHAVRLRAEARGQSCDGGPDEPRVARRRRRTPRWSCASTSSPLER